MSPLAFLLRRILAGRARRWARLVRQPKYLAGTVVGVAYFGWMVIRPVIMGGFGDSGKGFADIPVEFLAAIHLAAALAAGLYLSISWSLIPGKVPFRLRPAELYLLLTAPVTRPNFMRYAMSKSLVGILISVSIMSLFLTRGEGLDRLSRVAGYLVIFVLWDLHGKALNLWKLTLLELPEAQAQASRWGLRIFSAAFWVMTGVILFTLWRAGMAVVGESAEIDGNVVVEAFRRAGETARTGWIAVVLAPLKWLTAPVFASPGEARWPGWLLVAGLTVLHYRWMLNSTLRFEETLLDETDDPVQRKRERARKGMSLKSRTRVPWKLASTGRATTAIFWKNILAGSRWPWKLHLLTPLVLGLACGTGIYLSGGLRGGIIMLNTLGFLCAGASPFLAGMMWTNGFRRDLRHAEVLRTWPMSGRQMVLGQILGPFAQALWVVAIGLAVVLGTVGGSLLLAAADPEILAMSWPAGEMLGVSRPLFVLLLLAGILPVSIGVALLSTVLESIGVLLFPGWLVTLDAQRGDPAQMGQRILVGGGFLLVMLFGLLPGALTAGAVILVQRLAGIPLVAWEFPLLGLLAAGPLIVEGLVAIRWGGKLWREMDPSREILEGWS